MGERLGSSSVSFPLAYTLPIPCAAPVTMMVFFSSMGLALFCRPPRGKSFLEPPSVHMGAAVHGQRLPGDEIRSVREKEDDGSHEIFRNLAPRNGPS